MTIGVDSNVVIAGVHANHPRHTLAATWLIEALATHRLVVAHHSVLEAYAVLTRLPGDLRISPSEARDLLSQTVRANMEIADLASESTWSHLEGLVMSSVAGGRSYDAIVLRVLRSFGVDAVSTFNPAHFRDLDPEMKIIDPSAPPE